ncbi:MAG: hypothetical protein R3F59_31615 [Myxococcota bacterium]
MAGIMSGTLEFNGQVVGRVVVVGAGATPPSGYTAGYEYWTWTAGTPWRGAFKLVPGASVPAYTAYTWASFPHEHFDLSGTVPFPSVSPGPSDKFYKVSVEDGSSWDLQAYFWLDVGSPSVQRWYGVDLADDLVGDGDAEIRFESVEPPSAGSLDIYELE